MPNDEQDATHKSLVRLQTVLNKSLGVATLASEDACSTRSKRRTTTSSSSPHFDDDLSHHLLPRRQSSSDPLLSTRTFDPAPQFPPRSPAIEQASLILRLFATLAAPNNFNYQSSNPLLLPQQEQALLTLKLFKLLCAKHKQLKKYKSSLKARRTDAHKSTPAHQSTIHEEVRPAVAEVTEAIKESAPSQNNDQAHFQPRSNPPLRVRRPKTSEVTCTHSISGVYRVRSSPLKLIQCDQMSDSPPVYRVASVPYGHTTAEESHDEDYEEENLIAEIRRLRSFIEDLRSEIRPSADIEAALTRIPMSAPLLSTREIFEQQTQTSPSAGGSGQKRSHFPHTAPLQGAIPRVDGLVPSTDPPSFLSTSPSLPPSISKASFPGHQNRAGSSAILPVQWGVSRKAAAMDSRSEGGGRSGGLFCPIDPGLMPASLPRVKKSFFRPESRLMEEQPLRFDNPDQRAAHQVVACAFMSKHPRRSKVSSPLSAASSPLLNSVILPQSAEAVQSSNLDSVPLSTSNLLRKRLQDTQSIDQATLLRRAPGSDGRHLRQSRSSSRATFSRAALLLSDQQDSSDQDSSRAFHPQTTFAPISNYSSTTFAPTNYSTTKFAPSTYESAARVSVYDQTAARLYNDAGECVGRDATGSGLFNGEEDDREGAIYDATGNRVRVGALEDEYASLSAPLVEECTFSEQVEKALRLQSSVMEEEFEETIGKEEVKPDTEDAAKDELAYDRQGNNSLVDNFGYSNEFASCGSNQSPTANRSRQQQLNLFESPAEKFRRELQSSSEPQTKYQETLYYDQDYTRSNYAGLRDSYDAPPKHFTASGENFAAPPEDFVEHHPISGEDLEVEYAQEQFPDREGSPEEQGLKYTSADADTEYAVAGGGEYEEASSPEYTHVRHFEDMGDIAYNPNRRSKVHLHAPPHWNIGTPERLGEDGEVSPSTYASPKQYADD